MIYVKPRKKMNIERMRHQRDKHNPIRYFVHRIPRDTLIDLPQEVAEFMIEEMREDFRMRVARWHMWQKERWMLLPMQLWQDYDLDYNQVKFTFEVRRIRKMQVRQLSALVDRFCRQNMLTPNQVRVQFGLEPL